MQDVLALKVFGTVLPALLQLPSKMAQLLYLLSQSWCSMAKSPAWQRKEGKSDAGGLNAKGRASYNRANPGKPGLKAPQPEGGSRRDSFCARMSGMKKKLTSAKTANDPDSRINKSLRAWNC